MKKVLLWTLTVSCYWTAHGQTPGQAKFKEAQEYYYGLGRPYDPQKAFQLYTEAANAGYADAMNTLANMYAGGVTVEVDYKKAFSWYEKAGNAGSALAWNNLAMFYRRGEAVPQDFSRSFMYYEKGAALNNTFSKNSLAYFYFKGLGIKQSYSNAFLIYKELAEKGDVNAQYFTGLCYRNGYGTNADAELAKEWLTKAALKQDRQARHELNNEPMPENISVISPELQKRLSVLETYEEKFVAATTNDISGVYAGYAVYYDFSKTYVHEIVPLTLTLKQRGSSYEGVWKEGDSLSTKIKATFLNNNLDFDTSSKYVRNNYYSYRQPESYRFNSARLNIKYFNDSIHLSGDVQFYSNSRREPGQPMYIVLGRKALDGEGNFVNGNVRLSVFPNPVATTLKASFTTPQAGKVRLQLLTIKGQLLQEAANKTLPAGTYIYSINTEKLTAGTYILKVIIGTNTYSKLFIKQ